MRYIQHYVLNLIIFVVQESYSYFYFLKKHVFDMIFCNICILLVYYWLTIWLELLWMNAHLPLFLKWRWICFSNRLSWTFTNKIPHKIRLMDTSKHVSNYQVLINNFQVTSLLAVIMNLRYMPTRIWYIGNEYFNNFLTFSSIMSLSFSEWQAPAILIIITIFIILSSVSTRNLLLHV